MARLWVHVINTACASDSVAQLHKGCCVIIIDVVMVCVQCAVQEQKLELIDIFDLLKIFIFFLHTHSIY